MLIHLHPQKDSLLCVLIHRGWGFHACACQRLETNSVAVEVESAPGRRLCVFRDGLRERVAGLFKRTFACDGLRVPVKELALVVDV